MDDNQIDSDPKQYREEWFNVATPVGKEFELPNISSPLLEQWLMNCDTTESAAAAAGDAAATEPDLTAENWEIHTQIFSSPSPFIGTNHTSTVGSLSRSDSPKSDLILAKNQQSLVLSPSSKQTVAPVWVKSANFQPNSQSNQESSSSILPSACSNQNLKRGPANENETSPWTKSKQEVQDSVESNPPEELYAERKSSACCLHRLSMQINQSKSNEKTTENNQFQSDFEGNHICFVCNVAFASGNALGGHMSSHAKRRKMEVLRNGGLSIFKSDETFSDYVAEQGSDNGSNQPPTESVAATDRSTVSTEEKIEGNESLNKQKK